MSYFKLGVQGEGFAFFLPDSYRKPLRVLGSGVRRTINGTAKRDVVAKKYTFELGFNYLSQKEYLNFLEVFSKNIDEGKNLTFVDDEGTYTVIWGSGGFGLDDRLQDDEIFWSGTIILEEI
jgi:hypothetical protein